jgi:hypothetical protein
MTLLRARALQVAGVVALVCPTALAFASGGYFAPARLVALLVAWALVLVALALGAPLPARRVAWVALGALAAFTGWVAIAGGGSPLAATARGDLERDVLYLGALSAATLLLGGVRRLVEPLLTAGALVVIGADGQVAAVRVPTGRESGYDGEVPRAITTREVEQALARGE